MSNAQTIFVTGATGKQGGAVTKHLLQKGFQVKALTRNPGSTAAALLKNQNVQLIQGDLDNPASYSNELTGLTGIFSVQTFENGLDKEIKQGIQLADLAKQNNIAHFVYSSVAGADLKTGIPHWDTKFLIENHIRNLGLNHTILRPTSFYENFLIPQVRSRLLKGKLVSPVNKEIEQQFIAVDDIGRITAEIFSNPQQYNSKIFPLAAEQWNLAELSQVFSRLMNKNISYQKLPGIITRLAMGKNLFKMFSWINESGGVFIKDLDHARQAFPGFIKLETWIKQHFNPN